MEPHSSPPEQNSLLPPTEDSENWVRGFRRIMMSRESGECFMSRVKENATLILELTRQWDEYKKVVELKESSLKREILELKEKEERVSVVEERERKVGLREDSVVERSGVLDEKEKEIKEQTLVLKTKEVELVGVLQEKEKESDLRQFLEAVVIRLVLEMQNEERVTQINELEKLLQESMAKKHEVDEKRCELERKVTDFDLKQLVEADRRKENAELMKVCLKNLEAREDEVVKREEKFELKQKDEARKVEEKSKLIELMEKELAKKEENFELKQKGEASYVEAKTKLLELKEKELDEREKEIKERSIQAETGKRSRFKFGTPLLAEKGRDADSHIPPGKKHKPIRENIHDDKEKETYLACVLHGKTISVPEHEHTTEARSEGYEIVCMDDDVIDLDHEPYNCPEPEFYDFNKTVSSFATGQIWALYDHLDQMPRYYAQITRILKPQLGVRVTWLESAHNPKNAKLIPVACGVFKYGASETIDSHLMFSHEMPNITRSANSVIITPGIGETWALFRDWTKAWVSDREQHKPPYRYDLVEVMTELHSVQGIGVAFLGKVEGFTSVYKHAAKYGFKKMMISSDSMLKFSHRVPSVRLKGDEKEGVPVGSFELDPAAIPEACLNSDKVKEEEIKAIGWI